MIHIFRTPGPDGLALVRRCHEKGLASIESIESEYCFNVDAGAAGLYAEEKAKLLWLFTETFEPEQTREGASFLGGAGLLVEVGPRLAFSTAWSSNCLSMCEACGIRSVARIERSRRFLVRSCSPLSAAEETLFASLVHDRMTECPYAQPLQSFASDVAPAGVAIVPLLAQGSAALRAINDSKGACAFACVSASLPPSFPRLLYPLSLCSLSYSSSISCQHPFR